MAANFSGLPAAAPSSKSPTKSTKPTQCSCSNISIMQLFHEMKQEFPTVPDHVVTQLVAENCHNRPRCIEKLSEIEEEYALSTQAYPVQSIRNNKPPTPPRRCKNPLRQLELEQAKNTRDKSADRKKSAKSDESSCEIILNSQNNSKNLKENMCKFEKSKQNSGDVTPLAYNRPAPQRPNTLTTHKVPSSRDSSPRPHRVAPPPPISAGMTVLSQNPNAAPEALNVSLNVSVSPVSGRRPPPRPRHISEVTVQPEMPFSPAPVPANGAPRSYTSVNFTLRPPCTTSAQSPIDISAGPSLTYSSSSYDARQGYQSSLQITVGGTGTPPVFSAMRTRAQQLQDGESGNENVSGCGTGAVQELCDTGDIFDKIYQQRTSPLSSNTTSSTVFRLPMLGTSSCQLMSSSLREDEIVQRQLNRKRVLEKELHRDKYRLEIMQYDIHVLELTFPLSETDRLTEEIKQLRNECKMLNEILDKAGVAVLGDLSSSVNALSLTNQPIMSSNSSCNSARSPKRPPLPAALRTVTSPQRALQMPAFTNLQHLNLHQTPTDIVNNTIDAAAHDVPSWRCSVCTFQNHPLLNKCEQCEQPRNPLGTIHITAAHFEPRFENVQYQQQAHTNPVTARSFSLTNNVSLSPDSKMSDNQMVPQTAPPNTNCPFFIPNNSNFSSNSRIISSLEELQYENVVRESNLEEHTYVNVGSLSLGNLPEIFTNDNQETSSTFVKGHRYRPSM
ncbi:TGF-beta-activated kinase 1 and MAP3K7-binding protein 2 [Culicoides brevitarsis]|uniref:TGF-beta-activated kinase 1 and MAP3K7-binding protein 2 n=1 Tax=Culicoides brevitarsis TaxID=469753 RepID=UPI00307B3CCB